MPSGADRRRVQKTVLITGCSSGIGRAAAHAFNDEGWTVYATARNPADIETLGEAGCELATLDVTDQSDVDRVVDRILDEEGAIDALINNAGYGQFGPIEDVSTAAVHEQFDVNVYGPHRLTKAVLPAMRRERDGTIVNVSSVAGRVSFPGGGVYSGSKFAVEAMSDALRNEVAEHGIDVVVVEPGPVKTNFSKRAQAEAGVGSDGGEGDGDDAGGSGASNGDDDRSGAYEEFYALFEDAKLVGGGGPGAVEPEVVAGAIYDVASATQPPARVQPGTAARVGVLARFLPDAVLDRGYEFVLKFTS
ncbi:MULTISPECIES: SDR family oxidoreductase [unclassified Halorubrum]|uniref:SDR family oxidoreductase n=1 Tax=unclassified Halorubrum TaxID=2642239 RepID=UPI000B98ECBB|nr:MULTISPECIES: SDR family oxidoreductase [unclassified Halorubrum]OYR48689.1 short-chain dehydrogenase/reductase [Halorubrum sp. Eb13]OYR48750.1 short-chain dehydrogenase/reductase [Halorubrum sp. Ea1]